MSGHSRLRHTLLRRDCRLRRGVLRAPLASVRPFETSKEIRSGDDAGVAAAPACAHLPPAGFAKRRP